LALSQTHKRECEFNVSLSLVASGLMMHDRAERKQKAEASAIPFSSKSELQVGATGATRARNHSPRESAKRQEKSFHYRARDSDSIRCPRTPPHQTPHAPPSERPKWMKMKKCWWHTQVTWSEW